MLQVQAVKWLIEQFLVILLPSEQILKIKSDNRGRYTVGRMINLPSRSRSPLPSASYFLKRASIWASSKALTPLRKTWASFKSEKSFEMISFSIKMKRSWYLSTFFVYISKWIEHVIYGHRHFSQFDPNFRKTVLLQDSCSFIEWYLGQHCRVTQQYLGCLCALQTESPISPEVLQDRNSSIIITVVWPILYGP